MSMLLQKAIGESRAQLLPFELNPRSGPLAMSWMEGKLRGEIRDKRTPAVLLLFFSGGPKPKVCYCWKGPRLFYYGASGVGRQVLCGPCRVAPCGTFWPSGFWLPIVVASTTPTGHDTVLLAKKELGRCGFGA